jgi:uncharacterized protein YbjT (DUF2867 family)
MSAVYCPGKIIWESEMIVITGATGNIGSQVLAYIMRSDQHVRVIARSPSKLPPEAQARVEIIEGSHGDFDTVMRAFDGAEAAFWLVTGDTNAPSAEAAYVEFSRPGVEAMKAHGLKRVVGISALGRGWPKAAGHVTATVKLDELIATTGASYRALTCGSLMETILRQETSIRDRGVFYWPSPGSFKMRAIATRDVAEVASRLLLDPTWTGVEDVPLMGPEDVSFDEMARTMSEVLGKPVRFQPISMEDMREMMISRGATDGMAQAMVDMLTAKSERMDHLLPTASLTPTTFRQWAELVLKPSIGA